MNRGTYVALSGSLVRQQLMDTISHNLANNQTVGFKKGQAVFKIMLENAAAGSTVERVNLADIQEGFTDFSQGALNRTGVSTHLGIQGEGFFKVQDANEQIYYTRQGNMHLDREGRVMTAQDMVLLGEDGRPIVLPDPEVVVEEDGTVVIGEGERLKIPLYTFEDKSVLTRQGGGQFTVPPGRERELETQMEKPHIFQGQLENSNVNLMQEMSQMVESTRVYEACQKMLKTYNSLGTEANKLGSLT